MSKYISLYRYVVVAELPLFCKPGDMDDLNFMTRMKLSLLLDTSEDGKDWKRLCILLGLEPLLPAFNTVSSPTRELLNYYEVFHLMMVIINL